MSETQTDIFQMHSFALEVTHVTYAHGSPARTLLEISSTWSFLFGSGTHHMSGENWGSATQKELDGCTRFGFQFH